MMVNVPTKIIPIWFIERWAKENAEPGSSLDVFIKQMIKDWELEEIRQSKQLKDSFNADSARTGRVVAVFQGHTHWDAVYHTTGGIPVVTTTCDKYDLSGEPELSQEVRTLGTINEQAFDIMILNRDEKTITAIRIGAPAQNNVDKYRTDDDFEWVGTLEERVISYES